MEVETTTNNLPAATSTDVAAATRYIRGEDPRHIAREMGMSEPEVRNSIDRAVQTHEPTMERLNVARADIAGVLKRVNDALESGQVKFNSQAFHSLLARQMQARAMLDKYNGLDNPPEQPRLSITISDLVRIKEGKQDAPVDIEAQEAILVEELEKPRHPNRMREDL